MGYHDNAIFPYVELDTNIDDANAKERLQDLIDSINPLGVEVSEEDLVGDSTLLNGGILGKILRLNRVHLEDSKDRNELSESASGEAYSRMLESSLVNSVDFLFKNQSLKISDREASAKLIHALQESKNLDLDFSKSEIERRKLQFEVNYLMPLQREQIVEDIEFLHLKHLGAKINNDTSSFNLTSILPKESDKLTLSNTNLGKSGVLLDDDHDIKDLDKVNKEFTNTSILPKEATKLTKGNTILDDNHDLLVLDKANKSFVNTSLQPKEATLLTDKHDIQVLDKANKSFVNTSLQPKEAIILTDKHDLNTLEKTNKSFVNTSIQPKEASLLTDKHDLNSLEKTNKSFINTNIQPKESTLLTDKHDLNTLDKTNKSFVNTSLQPKESTLLTDKHDLNILEKTNRNFVNTNIQPKESSLLVDKHDLNILDKTNRNFVNTNLQPKESTLLTDKHDLNILEKTNKSFINTSIQPKESTLLSDKHDLNIAEKNIKTYQRTDIMTKDAIILTDKHNMNITENDIREYYRDFIQAEEKLTMIAERKIAEEKVLLSQQELVLGAKDIELKTKQIVLSGKDIELKTKQIVLDEKRILLATKDIELKTKQILLDEKRVLIAGKELDMKTYELTTMLPAKLSQINAEIDHLGYQDDMIVANIAKVGAEKTLVDKQVCVTEKDCLIKTYYNSDIQPNEASIAEAKATSERILAGLVVSAESLPGKKIEQMSAQTDLYVKQGDSYADKKNLDLLKIQTNYSAMVFADLEDPSNYTLALGGNTAVNTTFGKL